MTTTTNNDLDLTHPCKELWSRRISGRRVLIPYEGTLVLLLCESKLFMEARVTRPGRVTVRKAITGNSREEFSVGPIGCRHTISDFRRDSTHVSFSYHLEANYFGWFTIHKGPVYAQLPAADELEQAYERSLAHLQSIGPDTLASMTGETYAA